MIIDIIDENTLLTKEEHDIIRNIITAAANKLELSPLIEVDISIVSNEEIHALNKQYRNVDRPTDVLSFALEEDLADAPLINKSDNDGGREPDYPIHLGDIIISYAKVLEQAEDYGHSPERELAFLAVHGFLHLNGYDHQTEEEEAEMFKIQEEVLTENGYTR